MRWIQPRPLCRSSTEEVLCRFLHAFPVEHTLQWAELMGGWHLPCAGYPLHKSVPKKEKSGCVFVLRC